MAVVVIVVQIFLSEDTLDPPQYSNPTVASFSLGFGSILFAFGGAAVFPTIQNDMSDRSQFWKSVIIGFSGTIYGGQKINGQSLHYFDSLHEFLKLYKITK
ncbi:hypothetical protein E2C01_101063 [Portunus trituberculatus]|uniref:Amino acid transporter transmembrane domain-containing protein n=1 Tax=Portunus trituberculatus TaxID=210409 RepID=A0A5B7KL21_PORTR|nr:hypothetical protein [Portunus trituberculatus]